MSIKEKARQRSGVKERVITIPEWDCTLLVRGMTLLSRSECRAVFPDNGKPQPKHNAAFAAAVVISHCYDPETKKPAFDASDMDWLTEAEPGIIDRIIEVVNDLSGYNKPNPVDAAAKNSETTDSFAINSN